MTAKEHALVAELWAKWMLRSFSVSELLRGCAGDGGFDFDSTGLSPDALGRAWAGCGDLDWRAIGFFSSELLSFYAASESPLTTERVLRWLAAVLLFRDATRRGHGSMAVQIDTILSFLARREAPMKDIDKIDILRALVD
jgi:hypothetical protein